MLPYITQVPYNALEEPAYVNSHIYFKKKFPMLWRLCSMGCIKMLWHITGAFINGRPLFSWAEGIFLGEIKPGRWFIAPTHINGSVFWQGRFTKRFGRGEWLACWGVPWCICYIMPKNPRSGSIHRGTGYMKSLHSPWNIEAMMVYVSLNRLFSFGHQKWKYALQCIWMGRHTYKCVSCSSRNTRECARSIN